LIRLKILLFFACLAAVLQLVAGGQQFATPNVLLITIDTLRADRLGSYGYQQARTPVLDRLASEGVRFADATAHASLTYPSHVAILTGRYAANFGVRLNGMTPLPDRATTVAETLKKGGYRTAAVVSSVILDRSYGLDQGFDTYDDRITVRPAETIALSELQRSAAEVTTAATTWLKSSRAATSGGPFFLWAHYYDPHLPYSAPTRFSAAAPGRPYDAEISYVDAEVGTLLKAIDRGQTVVIVTADHGESLGDHGEPDHGFFLYDATLHVPLIVAGPAGGSAAGGQMLAPRVVREQVRSVDIAPTIAAIAGAQSEASFDGVSLVSLLQGSSRADVPVSFAESWYPRLHFGWSELRSVRVGEWKYIAAPKPELYDLRSDRGERQNRIDDRSAVAARLAAEVGRLSKLGSAANEIPAAQPDQATVDRLRALGYVGTFAPVTSGSGTENPLDRVADYRAHRDLFNRALGLLGQKRPAAAVSVLQQLVKTNVRAFEAHLYLGNAYAALSKWDAALGEYEVASMLNPALASPHFEAAKVLSARGEHQAAIDRCRKALEKEPRSFYGQYTLGVAYQKAQMWPEALATFTRAVEINGQDARAHANLAGAAMRTGSLDLAAAHFEKMIELKHQVPGAQFNLGVIAARKGDPAEAARRYRLALAADPSFKPAQDALSRVKDE
jgi:arylsulfatase A-like enzyme/Tfp pilus assembly protein PilF